MSELEVLEEDFGTEAKTAEYEALIELDELDAENLTVLIEEEKQLRQLVAECLRKQQEIKDKRYRRRADIVAKERAMNEAKQKEEEALRYRRLEEQKAQAFKEMVEYCREKNFAWVEYAKEHQWEGAMTIAHYGSAILGDDMGLGKTITSIMALDMKKSNKVLIVVPKGSVTDFADTVRIYAGHRNLIPIQGATPTIRKMVKMVVESSNEFTLVINYEALWNDFSWLENVKWDDIMVDEAHNMKSESSLTFNALDTFNYKNFTGITATSILNSPEDLYTTLHMVAPQQFWNKRSFLQNYCAQNFDGKWTFRPGGEKALMASMKGRFIKRSKEECGIILPKQTVNEVVIPRADVSEEQLRILDQIHEYNEILLDDGTGVSMPAIIAAITRERQAAVFPAGIECKITQKMYDDAMETVGHSQPVGFVYFRVPENVPSVKLDWASVRIPNMVTAGHRTVVFSQFSTALVGLEKELKKKGLRVARFDGETSDRNRLDIKRDFLRPASGEHKADYKFDVVLVNYTAGGVGLNFTDATYMLQLDEEWNPAKNVQARARIDRIGQTEETLVEILRIENGIDMWMKTLNEIKQAIVNGFENEIEVIDSLKAYFAKPEIEEQKAIEAPIVEVDPGFLELLKGF